MPRPPSHGVSRAGRMVRVLRYLTEQGGAADSTAIRGGVPGYEGPSGHRLWRLDLSELRSRGLVQPSPEGEEMSSLVERARLAKPRDLFLTRDEHAVLTRMSDAHGVGRIASPLPADSPKDMHGLARLTRYVEERTGRRSSYAEVQRATDLTEAQLTGLLRQIDECDDAIRDHTRSHPALAWISYLPPDDDDPAGFVEATDAVTALGAQLGETFDESDRSGQLGFFAYSAAEIDQRLALIATALAGSDLDAEDASLLTSARRKLRAWRTRLPR